MRLATIVAGFLTALWVGGAGLFVALRWETFRTLAPGPSGDFLAGVFAPVAFLWLILGFWLQREELAEARRAYQKQAEELEQSRIVQGRRLEIEQREALERRHAELAMFRFVNMEYAEPGFGSPASLVRFKNLGGVGYGVRAYRIRRGATPEETESSMLASFDVIEPEQVIKFMLPADMDATEFLAIVTHSRASLISREQHFLRTRAGFRLADPREPLPGGRIEPPPDDGPE